MGLIFFKNKGKVILNDVDFREKFVLKKFLENG